MTAIIELIRDLLGFAGGTSVWQILWEIPDADVRLLPAGRHREGTSVRRTLAVAQGHLASAVCEVRSHRAGGSRHRMAWA